MANKNLVFKNVEVLNALEAILHQNTSHYREDFEQDRNQLIMAAKKGDTSSFLWMSRPHGTYLVKERDVFLNDTFSHHVWNYFEDDSNILTIAITELSLKQVPVTDGMKELVMGNVYVLDYPSYLQRVKNNALQPKTVLAHYAGGDLEYLFEGTVYEDDDEVLGAFLGFELYPESKEAFRMLLAQEEQARKKCKESILAAYVENLYQERMKKEAEWLVQKVQADKGNGDKITVTVSADTMGLYQAGDEEYLAHLLPYQNATIQFENKELQLSVPRDEQEKKRLHHPPIPANVPGRMGTELQEAK